MKKPKTRIAGNVTSIGRSAAPINPPDGWELHSAKYGFMKTSDGEKLVSLLDVVKWLMQAREVHRPGALRIMLDALQPEALAWLYRVGRDRDPASCLLPKSDPWAQFVSDVPVRLMDVQRRGVADPELERWFAQPQERRDIELLKEGIESEAKYWFAHEAELDDTERVSSCTAILLCRAHSLWGLGTRIEEPLDAAAGEPGDEWSGARLSAQRERFRAEGARDFNKKTAILSGLDGREVRRRVRAAAVPPNAIAAMASSMTGKRAGGGR
jgi:hypothetical protein